MHIALVVFLSLCAHGTCMTNKHAMLYGSFPGAEKVWSIKTTVTINEAANQPIYKQLNITQMQYITLQHGAVVTLTSGNWLVCFISSEPWDRGTLGDTARDHELGRGCLERAWHSLTGRRLTGTWNCEGPSPPHSLRPPHPSLRFDGLHHGAYNYRECRWPWPSCQLYPTWAAFCGGKPTFAGCGCQSHILICAAPWTEDS